MRTGPAWAAGLALSALLHVAAAVILVPLYAPQEPTAQAPPETRLDMETVSAPRETVAAQDPQADPAAEGETQAASLGPGAVPQSEARPVAATSAPIAAVTPNSAPAQTGDPAGAPLRPAQPDTGRLSAADPVAEALDATAPLTQTLTQSAAPQAQRADAAVPQPQPLAAALPDAPVLGAGDPTSERAQTAAPAADQLAAIGNRGQAVAATSAFANRAAEALPASLPLSSLDAPVATLPAATPTPNRARAAHENPARLAPAEPATRQAQEAIAATLAASARAPASTTSAALTPPQDTATPIAESPASLPAADATGQDTAALPAKGTALPQARPEVPKAPQADPPATSATARLAWQFGDRVVTDPQALSTIQAFMEPAALDSAQRVKDDLSALLTGVDCARLSATFLPETGTLEMRGHIPNPELQGPILAALQAQAGEGVPVTANLLHLPAPQCGALTGIADVGLPQSTDQFTNARLVGETAHAREYNYTEGQRLQFDLTAPDYDAFVYVDYFNADGEVIHLVPNETIPLARHAAKSVFGVGQDRPGQPGLRITIGPPFGQEIAVAFASSHRLYEGVRPIVEPAAPYLEDLQARVAEARAAHEEFKGEWVYFFITTAPATQ